MLDSFYFLSCSRKLPSRVDLSVGSCEEFVDSSTLWRAGTSECPGPTAIKLIYLMPPAPSIVILQYNFFPMDAHLDIEV